MRTKVVNGERVDLTQAQEAARDAEEAAEAARPAPKKPITLDGVLNLLVTKGTITASDVAALKS